MRSAGGQASYKLLVLRFKVAHNPRTVIPEALTKVKLLLPNSQLVIALHSPNPPSKPDCASVLRRKAGKTMPDVPTSPFSAVRFVEEESRKMGIFRVFGGKERRNFSALQTAWRREGDSNPRYGFATLSLDISVSCR